MLQKLRYILPDTAAIMVALVIITLSLLSSSSEYVQTVFRLFRNDAIGHFVSYASLGFCALYRRYEFKSSFTTALCVIALGGVIELIQHMFGRSTELGDFIANVAGVCFAWALVLIVRAIRIPHNSMRLSPRYSGE